MVLSQSRQASRSSQPRHFHSSLISAGSRDQAYSDFPRMFCLVFIMTFSSCSLPGADTSGGGSQVGGLAGLCPSLCRQGRHPNLALCTETLSERRGTLQGVAFVLFCLGSFGFSLFAVLRIESRAFAQSYVSSHCFLFCFETCSPEVIKLPRLR